MVVAHDGGRRSRDLLWITVADRRLFEMEWNQALRQSVPQVLRRLPIAQQHIQHPLGGQAPHQRGVFHDWRLTLGIDAVALGGLVVGPVWDAPGLITRNVCDPEGNIVQLRAFI